jgi:hypothetical protein
MSQMGHSRRFDSLPVTSGLASEADIIRQGRLVRFVPNADVSRCSKRCSHLIGRSKSTGREVSPGLALGHAHWHPPEWRALLEAGLDGLQCALDGHCNWKRSFKKALTSSWDLFAAASW